MLRPCEFPYDPEPCRYTDDELNDIEDELWEKLQDDEITYSQAERAYSRFARET